ncbi:MAG: phosphodiester glycosidase family protein, partial [Oscillospiraceae bacterium]|nr:phosphodiester glycosidase family protein [Oscillospiraceae bacterium]
MKTCKRILAILLSLCIFLSVSGVVFAAETEAEPEVTDYESFLGCLQVLEGYASSFASTNTTYNVSQLMINYIRTGVERYLDGNWKTLAGEEITAFVNYVAEQDAAKGTCAGCLRNIVEDDFVLPNGDQVDFGHMYGALNIAYISSVASGDLGGWAGDLCDLMLYSREYGNVPEGTVDEKAAYILENCFGVDADHAYGMDDFYGDMDAFYLNTKVKGTGASLSEVTEAYFVETLTNEQRAKYFLKNRFSGLLTKEDVREAVYEAYTSNVGLQVLEADRELSGETVLREAVCYAFADYLYSLAGDTLTGEESGGGNEGETPDPDVPGTPELPGGNRYYTVFSSTTSTLAPGVTQSVNYAFTADDKQMAYFIATVDVNRDDLTIYANYKDNDPSTGWGMARVTDQIAAAVERHKHIENFTPVVGVNGDFYNMSTGKPSGALVMEGVTYNPANGRTFFAILDDGSAVIGENRADWELYEDRVQEAVGASIMLVKDGKPVVGQSNTYYTSRASRTCVGITEDGKVVLMVLDGRQEPYSCGGSYEELAQIMIDAGCVIALNLDGGGSTTFASKAEGSDQIAVLNSPSDGYARSVSSSLMVVSTAKISNEFDHAAIQAENNYLTIGTQVKISAIGVSGSGNAAPIPENAKLVVADENIGVLEDGVFTALENGETEIQMVLEDGSVAGSLTMHVVIPDNLYFTQENISAIYGQAIKLPVEATYNGNIVAINEEDVWLIPELDAAATTEGFEITGVEESGIRVLKVYALLLADQNLMPEMIVNFYRADEATFDFDKL